MRESIQKLMKEIEQAQAENRRIRNLRIEFLAEMAALDATDPIED